MFKRASAADVQPGDRSAGGASSSDATPLYEPLDEDAVAEQGSLAESGPQRSAGSCCINTQGQAFNLCVGLVVCASAVLLALEADTGLLVRGGAARWDSLEADLGLLGATPEAQQRAEAGIKGGMAWEKQLGGDAADTLGAKQGLRLGTYAALEWLIVLSFSLEVAFRLCDRGKAYVSDPWFGLDIVVLVQGMVDLSMPFIAGAYPGPAVALAAQMIRAFRVVRVVKILRVSPATRSAASAFGLSFGAVVRAAMVLAVLNFAIAILLTVFLGHNKSAWRDDSRGDIEAWFGSIGKSMLTLFSLGTLSGDERLSDVLSEVLPSALVFASTVAYVMLSVFTVAGAAVGPLSAALVAERRSQEAEDEQALGARRAAFGDLVGQLLAGFDGDRDGRLSRPELWQALGTHPELLGQLRTLGVGTSTGELMLLFDRLCYDYEGKGTVTARIDDLVCTLIHLGDTAKAAGVAELRFQIIASRRESMQALKSLPREVLKLLPAKGESAQREAEQAAETRKSLAALQEAVCEVQQGVRAVDVQVHAVATLEQRLARLELLQEQAERSRVDASAALTSRLDAVAAQVPLQASALAAVSAKLDALMAVLADPGATVPAVVLEAAKPLAVGAAAAPRVAAVPAVAEEALAPEAPAPTQTHAAAAAAEPAALAAPALVAPAPAPPAPAAPALVAPARAAPAPAALLAVPLVAPPAAPPAAAAQAEVAAGVGAADEGMPRGAEDLADFADFTNAPSSPVGAPWTASFPSSGATSPAGPAEPSGDAGGARLGWSQDDVLPMEPSRRPSLPQWQAAGASSAPPPTSPAGPTTSASARTTGAEAAAAWEAAGAEAAAGLPAAAPAPAGAEAAGAEEGEEECGREHDADQSSVDSVLGSGVMRDLSADELFDRLLSSDRP